MPESSAANQPPTQGEDGGEGLAIPFAQASHLLTTFTHFLTVCVHNILYYRNLYPAQTFLTSRAYNLPVHQSRHPKVCTWVRDAIDAVRAQLVLGTAERIAVVVYDDRARVLERWMFDVANFPAWAGAAREGQEQQQQQQQQRGFEERGEEDSGGGGDGDGDGSSGRAESSSNVNWADVHEELRAAIRRLAHAGEKMIPLPDGCTFTIAVELREEGEAPIGHPQSWLPAQANLQPKSKERQAPGQDIGGAKTIPLRAVEAGPLFFECWIEEGRAKGEHSIAPTLSTS